MNTYTLREIKDMVKEFDPNITDQHDGYREAVILLAAAHIGTNVESLAALTGYSKELVAIVSRQMHSAQLWKEGAVHCDGWTGPAGVAFFWRDVLIAEGLLVRKWSPEDNDYVCCPAGVQ